MHTQQLGRIFDGAAVLANQLAGMLNLRRGEGSRARAELHASRLGCLTLEMKLGIAKRPAGVGRYCVFFARLEAKNV